MDDRGAEFGSPGEPSGEASASLDKRYASMGESIATFYKATSPKEEPKKWQSRLRVPGFRKPKDTRATDTLSQVKEVFQTHFPQPDQQAQVAEGANQFLHKLANAIDPEEGVYDDHLSNFISGFPDNIIARLDDQATPDTVSRIFQIGSNAIDKHIQRVSEIPPEERKALGNVTIRTLEDITILLTEDLPEAIKNAGESEEMLSAKLEKTARSERFGMLEGMVTFYRTGIYEPSSSTQGKIARLNERIAEIDPHADISSSPFNRSDREAWKGEMDPFMGSENRPPTWKDLADMARSTEEDDIEFGMTFSRDSQDSSLRKGYKRGRRNASINNSGNHQGRTDVIFFHSHPSHTSINYEGSDEQWTEVNAPLISDGDPDPNYGMTGDLTAHDYEGGYFNVVTINGVTFQAGIEAYDSLPTDVDGKDSEKEVYVIESGKRAGSWFKHERQYDTKTRDIMQSVKDNGEPFVYSIYEPYFRRRRYFVHIPWDKIDGSVPFEEVCYGNGLKDMVGKFSNLPQIPVASNVLEGLKRAA